MNGCERIKNALDGKWPDRRPVMLHNFMSAAYEAGMSMSQYRSSPENISKSLIAAVEKYGLDGVLVDVDTSTLAGAIGAGIDYPIDAPARCFRPAINSVEQIPELKLVDISKNERVQIWLESVMMIKRYFGNEIFVRGNCDQMPFSLASMVLPAEEMMMALVDEEKADALPRLLEYCTDVCCQFIRLMAATGADMVSNGDSVAGPDVVSPAIYRRFALKYEQKVVSVAKSLGKYHLLHICGNADGIVSDMIETGTDALELDFKTNIALVAGAIKNRVAFSGNIDPTGVMAQGTPEMVRAKTLEILKCFDDNPRLILNAGCALPATTPSENIRALVDAAK